MSSRTFFASALAVALAGACSRPDAGPEQSRPEQSPSEKARSEQAAVASASARPSAGPGKAAASAGPEQAEPAKLLPALKAWADSLTARFTAIPAERKAQLEKLGLFLKTRLDSGQAGKVVFICTHNSRRSHMGQTAATLAAAYYGLEGIEAYSGGTEATAFNPRAVAALKRAGYQIKNPGGDNPHYKVKFAENRPPIEAFSKKYDSAVNPKQGFAAVMTCGHADRNCPTVAGAAVRIPLHFVDPKQSDGTPREAATYDERARQIATEVFYAMSRVKG